MEGDLTETVINSCDADIAGRNRGVNEREHITW